MQAQQGPMRVPYLGPGSEEAFVDQDGNSYTLRVDAIRKEQVTPKRIGEGPACKNSSQAHGERRGGRRHGGAPLRAPKLFGDLVTESTAQTKFFNGDQTGR